MDDTYDNTPSTNGDNGTELACIESNTPIRDHKGRFLPGNPGGPGNPQAHSIAAYRRALVEAVSADDIAQVIKKLVDAAKAGEPWAIRELLDRCLGKPHVQIGVSVDDSIKAQSEFSEEQKREAKRIAAILIDESTRAERAKRMAALPISCLSGPHESREDYAGSTEEEGAVGGAND